MSKTLPVMEDFRRIAKAGDFTSEGLRDLLNSTVLLHDPVSTGCVFRWMKGYGNPRAEKIPAIEQFVRSHNRSAKAKSKRK